MRTTSSHSTDIDNEYDEGRKRIPSLFLCTISVVFVYVRHRVLTSFL